MTVWAVEVGIGPKPAFRSLFKIATTRVEKGVVLLNETLLANGEPEALDLCFRWRRGGLNSI